MFKHYLDENQNIRAIENGIQEQEDLVGGDWTPLSDSELYDLLNPPPTPEEERQAFKVERAAQVAAITVTTQASNTFDGDEISQERMARAILAMDDTETVNWILADNTVIDATRVELSEALKLAGAAQAAIWVQ